MFVKTSRHFNETLKSSRNNVSDNIIANITQTFGSVTNNPSKENLPSEDTHYKDPETPFAKQLSDKSFRRELFTQIKGPTKTPVTGEDIMNIQQDAFEIKYSLEP